MGRVCLMCLTLSIPDLTVYPRYPIDQCTWQHEEDMGDSPALIREFVADAAKEGKSMLPEEHVYLNAAESYWRR